VYIAYLDESGVVEKDANTSHFVLVAVAIPAPTWKAKDACLSAVKQKHRLTDEEVHTAFLMGRYPEQERIKGFSALTDKERSRWSERRTLPRRASRATRQFSP
jgi:hypothetical protein